MYCQYDHIGIVIIILTRAQNATAENALILFIDFYVFFSCKVTEEMDPLFIFIIVKKILKFCTKNFTLNPRFFFFFCLNYSI